MRKTNKQKALAKTNAVANSIGTSTAKMVRLFVAEIATAGKVPVTLNISENKILAGFQRRNKIWSQLDDTQNW